MDDLTNKEILLIQALREMGEIPVNMLLWYSAGLEGSIKKIEKALEKEEANKFNIENKRKIHISQKYQGFMSKLNQS